MLLSIKDLFLNFEGLSVTNNINMEIEENSITALIGPNGSGKTTLFNLITGIYKPDSGEIIFCERNICGLKPYQICKLGISRTYQAINLFKNLTVIENVLIGMHTQISTSTISNIFHTKKMRAVEKESYENACGLLKLVNLESKANNISASLSYGEQRLLEIVRAIASNPKLILLDEPAAGMNETEKIFLNNLINKIVKMNITVLLVEHDMQLVMNIANKIYVIDAGKNLAYGTPHDIQQNKDVIKAYLGGD